MSANSSPKVSIGLPVYNGENFLEEAIRSILEQTFEDFELIISDNASIDQTETICRFYTTQDRRVKYFRHRENIGASGNFNKVFELSSGEYFKWASHDDVCRPDFIKRCAEVLDKDSHVVLCYTRTITIDEQGQFGKKWPARPEFGSGIPYKRFREVLAPLETFPIWGLIRSRILQKTPLHGFYPGSDVPLLTELSLHGRFFEIQEFLFLSREHRKRSVRQYNFRKPHEAIIWYAPKLAEKMNFPVWRLFAELVTGINRAPLSLQERLPCYIVMAKWLKEQKYDLLRDLMIAGARIPIIGQLLSKVYKESLETNWLIQTKRVDKDLELILSMEDTFILVDEARFDPEVFARWRTIPFLEREGQYWGPPPDDNTAICEVGRLCRSGANFIVFGWPAFWWLDHYAEFNHYLRSNFSCVMENERLVVFDLRPSIK